MLAEAPRSPCSRTVALSMRGQVERDANRPSRGGEPAGVHKFLRPYLKNVWAQAAAYNRHCGIVGARPYTKFVNILIKKLI